MVGAKIRREVERVQMEGKHRREDHGERAAGDGDVVGFATHQRSLYLL
jgi:hypothetical protein